MTWQLDKLTYHELNNEMKRCVREHDNNKLYYVLKEQAERLTKSIMKRIEK